MVHHYRCCRGCTGLLARAVRSANHQHTLPGAAIASASVAASATFKSSSFHTSASRDSRSSHGNHYEQLGLTKDATKKEIKTQFYKLSKLHHPDKNASEESRRAFLSINDAYSVLGDDRQRRDYDITLLDKSGSLYSDSSSQRAESTRGTLRRTPFRHSAQSAAAAAAARGHASLRPNNRQNVSHFDAKSHQEMHYEQELRQEERRQARMRASEEFKYRQKFEESDSYASKAFRVSFLFVLVIAATSFMKVFADESEPEDANYDRQYTHYPPVHL
ncbi:hypothetical protein EDD21DRAFT_107275 [Dissophora ornata]|nr:hypothetical protein BGZ58_005766 [Dissophora ornata]KAI8601459.1 hypothetical protein EDD21DRAFT_107275 [Dissophora ornata]